MGRVCVGCAFSRAGALAALAAAISGCPEGQVCEEDIRAQVLDERATIELADATLEVEVARSQVERERGWKHRRCDLEGLLLIPEMTGDAAGDATIWGCGLTLAVDLYWLRDGEVVALVDDLEPCAEPCAACPIVGEGIVADAVLEVPRGAIAAGVGDPVVGLEGLLVAPP